MLSLRSPHLRCLNPTSIIRTITTSSSLSRPDASSKSYTPRPLPHRPRALPARNPLPPPPSDQELLDLQTQDEAKEKRKQRIFAAQVLVISVALTYGYTRLEDIFDDHFPTVVQRDTLLTNDNTVAWKIKQGFLSEDGRTVLNPHDRPDQTVWSDPAETDVQISQFRPPARR